MKHKLDDENKELIKARQEVADATGRLVEAISNLEGVIADILYDRAFNDGVQWMKDELGQLTNTHTVVEKTPAKVIDIPEVEKIAQDYIMKCVVDIPGIRTSDITTKISSLPFKPNVTDRTVWIVLNRLKMLGKIYTKEGRWYVPKANARIISEYQGMQLTPDGSKYLGSDVVR